MRRPRTPAYLNRNGQVVIRNTGLPGTDHLQTILSATLLNLWTYTYASARNARLAQKDFRMTIPNGVILCRPRVTVGRLQQWLDTGEKQHVADFIRARFVERYFLPIEALEDRDASGFAMMALSCLIIESLESFHSGVGFKFGEEQKGFPPVLSSRERLFCVQGLCR